MTSLSRPPARWCQRESGVALVIALVMLSVVLVVTGVLLRNSRQQEQLTARKTDVARAQFAAELGLREALQRLTVPGSPNAISKPTPSTTWTATGSGVATDHQYAYTISFKKIGNTVVTTERGQPIFVITSEGRSAEARRRAELAVIDIYNPAPFGWGLVGCTSVFLDGNVQTRALNSSTTTFPTNPPLSKFDGFSNAGDILALGTSNIIDSGKTRGTVDVDSSSLVRGKIVSQGTVNVASSSVRGGPIDALGIVTLDGRSVIEGAVYGKSISGTAKWTGGKISLNSVRNYVIPDQCDLVQPGVNVTKFVDDAIVAAATNSNGEFPSGAKYYTPSNRKLEYPPANSKGSQPVETISLGDPAGQVEKTYFFSSVTLGTNSVLKVFGRVNVVIDQGDFVMSSKDARLDIAPGSSLRIYTKQGVILDQAPINYLDNNARPTSLVIYSSASNGSSLPNTLSSAKIQLAAPNTIFRGLVFAPYAYIWVKQNNSLYGSLRGNWIRFDKNTTFTYDQAASSIDATPQGYRIAYWSEQPYDNYPN